MTALYWDTAPSTPGKPPPWLTEVTRLMVRHVGFAGNAGGPSENDKPDPPDRASINLQPPIRCPLNLQPRRDAPWVNAAVGIVCINLRPISPPGPSPRDNRANHAGTFTRGSRLFFFGAPGMTPHKERGFERMVFSIFDSYLVFFKGFSIG